MRKFGSDLTGRGPCASCWSTLSTTRSGSAFYSARAKEGRSGLLPGWDPHLQSEKIKPGLGSPSLKEVAQAG